ncbi:MAG: GTP 3',8-cyclase MoaA, partial [Planctomycetota bacterium]
TSGIEEISLTTNGVLLEQKASELKAAGMHRVNVSIDSAERESYKQITGFDLLPQVTRSIYKAIAVGLTPVKINSVIIRDINDSQIPVLAEMSIHLPIAVRFIEYCPTNKNTKPGEDYVPTSKVREVIERRFGQLSPVLARNTDGPALYFKICNAAGTIGFISGRSSTFCHDCNRLRLTSDGKIKPCLYSAYSYDVRKLIRSRANDAVLRALLRKILYEKSSHTRLSSPFEQFSMKKIGG